MFNGIQALLTIWGLLFGSAVCFSGAVAAYIYVPVIGRWVAIVLVALGSALAAYNYGYSARGALDNSGSLQAQLAEANRQLQATQTISLNFAAKQALADINAATQQDKINVYEARLKAEPQTGGCGLTDDDLVSLRDIGVTNPPIPAKRPSDLRPAGRSTSSH